MKVERMITTKDTNEYSLGNFENYKEALSVTIQDILDKLVRVLVDYIVFITEKININNEDYYHFIFERGVSTLLHVFTITLYHTNNLDLAIYHAQKAFYFYIEFIEQIADDNVTFLKLSSKDAVLFVYKRTIFEINNDFRKKTKNISNDENKMYVQLNMYVDFYRKILHNLIKHYKCEYNLDKELINKKCLKIEDIGMIINKLKLKNIQIECINIFYDMLIQNNIDFDDSFELILSFAKEILCKKTILSQKNIKENLLACLTTNYINENGKDHLIHYIFTEVD